MPILDKEFLTLKIIGTCTLNFFLIDFLVWAAKETCVTDGDCTCADGMIAHCHHGKCYCHHSTHECNHPEECGCDPGHHATCDNHLCHCHPMSL